MMIFNPLDSHVPGNKTFCPLNRHHRQAADLPAKVAKRIGCAHIRGDVPWRLDGAAFSVEFLVNFYVTFPCKTTYFAQHKEGSRDLSGQIPSNATSGPYLDQPEQANCNKSGSRVHILFCYWKKG